MVASRAISTILLWTISCLLVDNVHGAPQFFVSNATPKCHSVEVAKETTVKIHYEAPDIDLQKDSRQYKPTYVTVVENPIETLEEKRHEHDTDTQSLGELKARLNGKRKHKPKVVSQELTDVYGSFIHKTHSEDAVVEVCIRASKATEKTPMLFHLRVEELEEDVLDEFEKEKAGQEGVPLLGAEHHWSFMETQLDRIEHEMHNIIKEADFFRERDALYHQQTDDLHKATLFWPILHCCILALTGFTQANHIISFFKSKRII